MLAQSGEETGHVRVRAADWGPWGHPVRTAPRVLAVATHLPGRLAPLPAVWLAGCLSPKPELGVTKGRPGSRCPGAGTAGPGPGSGLVGSPCHGDPAPPRSAAWTPRGRTGCWEGKGRVSVCVWGGAGRLLVLTPSQPVQDTLVSQRSLGGPPNPLPSPSLPLHPTPKTTNLSFPE